MSGTNRKKVWQITALFAALLVLPLFSATAHADRLSLGAIFRIGGVHFNLAFGDFGYGHPRGYYYRTIDPISYGGYRCNSYCFTSGGYHYHSDSCPLVRRHLAYFEIDPLSLYDRYAPGYGSGYGYNYGYGYGYDNYGGYNNYNNYGNRYDGYRYDRRGGYNRYDNRHDRRNDRYDRYPYPDRRYDRDRDRHDGRRDRDRHDGRRDRDRRDDRHDRRDDRHHGGHSSSGRPQHH